MATLHLLNKDSDKLPQPTDLGFGLWATGAWHVSEKLAESMVGAAIHIHRGKAEPSFKAGKIVAHERRTYSDPRDGKPKLRTYFIFKSNPTLQGAITGPEGWLQSGIKWIP